MRVQLAYSNNANLVASLTFESIGAGYGRFLLLSLIWTLRLKAFIKYKSKSTIIQ
jgi:hypothetical protein